MERGPTEPGGPAGRRARAGALALLLAVIGAGGSAAADERQRRDAGPAVDAPKQPIGAPAPASHAEIALSRKRLLAGRPGQRLGVRYRVGRGEAESARIRVILRRVRREDPRHPGARVGGERVAAAVARLGPRGGEVRLRGLNPQPGPHRVIVERAGAGGGERLAATRIAVLPQSRTAAVGAAVRASGRSGGTAATPQSLAADGVDHDLSFRPGSESSSAIAVETDNPARAIAAADDVGARPLAYISEEGLAPGSAIERRFPAEASLPGGAAASIDPCCEPSVAADAAGNLWMAAAEQGSGGRVAVNRIEAGSDAFNPASAALPISSGSAQEKPALAVDDGVAIAAVWIETVSGLQNVVYSGCDLSGDVADCDDADEWTDPIPVTGPTGGLYSMPDAAFAPNGDLYVTWWDAGSDNAVERDRCLAAESCSSAGSWNEEGTIAGLDAFDDDGVGGDDPLPLFCPIIAAPGGLVGPAPSVEVGPGGHVFVAYSDLRDNPEPGAESRCTASGSDKTFDSFVAASAGPNSFPAPGSGVRISDDGALELNDHFLPALSVDPSSGAVEASFYSTAGDPGGQSTDRVYTASTDLGASYSTTTTISDARSRFAGPLSDGIDFGSRQDADSAAGTFRPAWTDNRALQSRDPDLYALGSAVETTIEGAPSGVVADAEAKITFSSPAPRIECRLDGEEFSECSSPRAVGPLPNGPHSFQARATDRAGNVADPSAASAEWTVADFDPPETTITRQPKAETRNAKPRFEFIADENAAEFECRYDGGAWSKCNSPQRERLDDGAHNFRVRATDVGGNTDPTPARHDFVVDTRVSGRASAKRVQRQPGPKVRVEARLRAGEELEARARGKVKLGGRSFELARKRLALAAGRGRGLRLRPGRGRDERRLVKALRRGARPTAKLRLRLLDGLGNEKGVKLRVELRR